MSFPVEKIQELKAAVTETAPTHRSEGRPSSQQDHYAGSVEPSPIPDRRSIMAAFLK